MASTSRSDETTAIEHQKLELLHLQTLESDQDYAYHLQLQEAFSASLSFPSSSSISPPAKPSLETEPPSSSFSFADCMAKELEKLEQGKIDRELSEIEAEKCKQDLGRRMYDQEFVIDLRRLSEEDWDDFGDDVEFPFAEGPSSSSLKNIYFRLYFKGLVEEERVGDSDATLCGIGVAIYDPRGNLIFELSKSLPGTGKSLQLTEIKALIEGLETAVALNLEYITICCDYPTIYQYVRQAWQPKQRKMVMLMKEVEHLRKKFTHSQQRLVSRKRPPYSFKLARDAIVSQMARLVEANDVKNLKETCVICLEERDQDKMFIVDSCLHRYCFSCMKQYVEAKMHSGVIPKCPHESCKSELNVKSCENFLTSKLIKVMRQRTREASIPVAEKVYCPYPRCSALMSKAEVSELSNKVKLRARMLGARQCVKCRHLFCINCCVPWHKAITCAEFKRSRPFLKHEDAVLKSLATRNLWRQCVKCNHMIELAEGCYHMTCRCGYEFCYTCGAEWKNKNATCKCPLWNEENIMFDDSDYDDEFDEEDEFDEDEFDDDSDEDSEIY